MTFPPLTNNQYKAFIEQYLMLVDKTGQMIPFVLNPIQSAYLSQHSTRRDVVLKARQQGFSSVILGRFTADFILTPNSHSVVVADTKDNAIALLERVKLYLQAYEELAKTPVVLKYNSKYELMHETMNSKYTIGTAENAEFGRSRTITNLHLSEAAFYPQFRRLLASALQAVTPTGYAAIETTANGFNEFKAFWDETKLKETGFTPLFYKASEFYPEEFRAQKRKELGRLYPQEYPETDMEAFLTSGDSYFETDALQAYMTRALSSHPMHDELIYV